MAFVTGCAGLAYDVGQVSQILNWSLNMQGLSMFQAVWKP